jgi:hypothetical protein
VAASGQLGTPWYTRGGTAKKGDCTGIGEDDTWEEGKQEVDGGDDGRAAARGAALAAEHMRQGKTEQSMCSGKKNRGEGVRGLVCKT